MQLEIASSIAGLSRHWSRVHHLTFDRSLLRPGFARWVEDPRSSVIRTDGKVMLFAYLRQVARLSKLYFPRMLWVCREERGSGGRYHLHVLSNGWINPSACSALWKWGRCEVSEYDPQGNIADYVCKCLGSQIEISRFSGRSDDLTVTWSTAALRLFNGLLACGRVCQGETMASAV